MHQLRFIRKAKLFTLRTLLGAPQECDLCPVVSIPISTEISLVDGNIARSNHKYDEVSIPATVLQDRYRRVVIPNLGRLRYRLLAHSQPFHLNDARAVIQPNQQCFTTSLAVLYHCYMLLVIMYRVPQRNGDAVVRPSCGRCMAYLQTSRILIFCRKAHQPNDDHEHSPATSDLR